MNTAEFRRILPGDLLDAATPPGWTPAKFLEAELSLASGEQITRHQAERYVKMWRSLGRIAQKYDELWRSILLASIVYMRADLEDAEAALRGNDEDLMGASGASTSATLAAAYPLGSARAFGDRSAPKAKASAQ